MKRRICVVTGTRAEYGLLNPIMEEIRDDADLELQLVVTGMHLSPEFGLTYREIEQDGFIINEKIEILLSSDTTVGISKSMGLAVIAFAEAFERLKPHIILGLGDRFELFSAISAALVGRIPVAHLYGGEISKGAFDDSFRHCITKMSHLHFTSTEEYRKRVVQLGEHPERVFNVGAVGLDNIKRLNLLSRGKLEKELGINFNKHNLLVTFHPVTLENSTSEEQFRNLLNVLDDLEETTIIFTKANADTFGRIINKMIDEYASRNAQKAVAFTSMGQLKYLSAMQFVDAVVGNSSSGIIEAPSFRIGTINIGDRQGGRIKAKSVIDCDPSREGIRNALDRLYSSEFQENLRTVSNPFGDGQTAARIKEMVKKFDISHLLKKSFYDVDFSY